ncbi:hypothetical protein K439DRAFT_1624859 [Ramaria rubella]|nr:hypothetical protein K439DRAFT_1624859 [Ramaria rubella]
MWAFFDKVTKTCKVCRDRVVSHPKWVPPKYIYAKSTGNTSLHVHLQSNHHKEYIKMVEEKGWVNMLPGMQHISDQATLDNHLVASGSAHPKFSQSTFINALVKFIVEDDQSLNVIECQEFHALLLLLCEGLTNDDIPHHTNIHKQIICAWEFHFQCVKENIANTLGKISHTADICSTIKGVRAFLNRNPGNENRTRVKGGLIS